MSHCICHLSNFKCWHSLENSKKNITSNRNIHQIKSNSNKENNIEKFARNPTKIFSFIIINRINRSIIEQAKTFHVCFQWHFISEFIFVFLNFLNIPIKLILWWEMGTRWWVNNTQKGIKYQSFVAYISWQTHTLQLISLMDLSFFFCRLSFMWLHFLISTLSCCLWKMS